MIDIARGHILFVIPKHTILTTIMTGRMDDGTGEIDGWGDKDGMVWWYGMDEQRSSMKGCYYDINDMSNKTNERMNG
jgi:hypothetical protein